MTPLLVHAPSLGRPPVRDRVDTEATSATVVTLAPWNSDFGQWVRKSARGAGPCAVSSKRARRLPTDLRPDPDGFTLPSDVLSKLPYEPLFP
jgi:hypothetical protein